MNSEPLFEARSCRLLFTYTKCNSFTFVSSSDLSKRRSSHETDAGEGEHVGGFAGNLKHLKGFVVVGFHSQVKTEYCEELNSGASQES